MDLPKLATSIEEDRVLLDSGLKIDRESVFIRGCGILGVNFERKNPCGVRSWF